MLHIGVGAESKALLTATLGVEADKVAGDILDFGFGAFLELVPRTGAETREGGRLTVGGAILADFIERVDGYIDDVAVLVLEFHALLLRVAVGNGDKAHKLTHTVVNVDDIVAWLKLSHVAQRVGKFSVGGTGSLKTVAVEAVEYLVVCKEASLKGVVDEACVEGELHRGEGNGGTGLFKDSSETLVLLGVVSKDIKVVTTLLIVSKGGIDDVEVLMEEGLRLD